MPILTDTMVKAAKAAPGKRLAISDDRQVGLQLRVSDKGHKSWSVLYRANGSKRPERSAWRP